MLIRDVIQTQGNVLFRYRGYVPLLLVPAAFFALQESEWIERRFGDLVDDVYDWFCVGLSMAGLALRVATVAHVPRRTSGRNTRKGQVADELNTTGLYSIVRHPLYLANVVILTGFLLATGSLWFTIVGLLACCLHYERVACAEEAFLMTQFGARYLAWVRRTPAFLPRLPLASVWIPSARRFCWRTALKREYQTAFALIAAFASIDYAEDVLALGRLEFEPETTIAFAVALGAFVLVRYLHKRTRVL